MAAGATGQLCEARVVVGLWPVGGLDRVESNVASPIIDGISKLEDRVLVNASNVVFPEIEPHCMMGLKSGFLLKYVKDDLVDSGGRSEGLVLGSVNSLELGDVSKSKISGKECVGGAVEDVSCVPELSIRNKKKMQKFGSMLNIQDSVLSKAERSRRDRALKSFKLKKSDLESSELSGRSISDSDIKKKWGAAFPEAKETLSVAKMLGITFVGPERKVLEELVSLELWEFSWFVHVFAFLASEAFLVGFGFLRVPHSALWGYLNLAIFVRGVVFLVYIALEAGSGVLVLIGGVIGRCGGVVRRHGGLGVRCKWDPTFVPLRQALINPWRRLVGRKWAKWDKCAQLWRVIEAVMKALGQHYIDFISFSRSEY
ncbi:hypothetical protein F3Y22_tig00002237pilonHSYRG01676 [Hibiscus syriacus]|uniref:Uncharacterized protein n=1 Tax=Hibiscus syriacus TaxID=106335 RepID=A0A6A3CUX3_HIBSY|nr:hypothetical protein F3Y22_tig00002237pilonHSYRG01676 [Hibiscus syriacus]